MLLIKLNSVHFSYNRNRPNSGFSLNNINIGIEKGEFVTILGPNGSGKSTLLKIMSGLLLPKSGSIYLKNNAYSNYTHKELARIIAFVPQTTISIFPFSVYEIVMMGRTPYLNFTGYEKTEDRKIVDEALEVVGISHLKYKGINEVSGGEAQRAFIARALAQKPEIILLDEPNAHLDIKHQISIFNLLKRLNEDKKLTVVSVSHDLNLAGNYGKRTILMNRGEIFKDSDKFDVLTEENIKKIFDVQSRINIDKKMNFINVVILPHVQDSDHKELI